MDVDGVYNYELCTHGCCGSLGKYVLGVLVPPINILVQATSLHFMVSSIGYSLEIALKFRCILGF